MPSCNFNDRHPELREGEVLCTNITDDAEGQKFYERLRWKTKRLGNVAYDIYGNRLEGIRPVFMGFWEFARFYGYDKLISR
jgi:hypothetical protein